MPYFDCYLAPVARAHRAAYEALAEASARVIREHGAVRVVECWLDESGPEASSYHGTEARKATLERPAFAAAAGARAGETVVMSWVEWPNRATRDAGMEEFTRDRRVQFEDQPAVFDGERLIAGGFVPMLEPRGNWRMAGSGPESPAASTEPEDSGTRPGIDLDRLLADMRPELAPGRYAFVALPQDSTLDSRHIVASIREPEGLSVIVEEAIAEDLGLPVAFTAAWITLRVPSDLAAVGLTAAFSRALAQAGISCNVVAGVHHDHLFVPFDRARQAMDALHALSRSARPALQADPAPPQAEQDPDAGVQSPLPPRDLPWTA